jgi:erythromycin esterase-like protein
VLIGFGTDRGTVAAATDWGGEMEVKQVRPALAGSYEQLCRDAGASPSFLLDFDAGRNLDLVHELQEWPRLERAIGVIYRPETERWSHYFEANLPSQFDAFIWFDETRAVTPLPSEDRSTGLPDTYPFGV